MSTPEGDGLSLPRWVPALFATVSFAACVFYAYALLVLVPAPGFNALNPDWIVVSVEISRAAVSTGLEEEVPTEAPPPPSAPSTPSAPSE